ncbi:hypothetical protein [Actinocatenispora rupis]|nr:hypothetical protein [Actinocatenispora rupis]
MTQLEEQIAALYDEQQRAIELAAELQRCRSENVDLRARLSGVPVVHHVGGKVEEILSAAEQQALEIRSAADRHLAAARDDAVQIVAVAKHQAARARRDCDLVLHEHRRAQQRAAAEIVATARAEADRIVDDARRRAADVPESGGQHAAEEPRPSVGRLPAPEPAKAAAEPVQPAAERHRSRSAGHDTARRTVPRLGEEPA